MVLGLDLGIFKNRSIIVYNVVVISAVQQNKSVMYIHISPLSESSSHPTLIPAL